MASTLLLIVLAWAVTVCAVLAVARLLGRVSAPAQPRVDEQPPPAPPRDNAVPLVPRPQNALVPVAELRRAS